MVKAIQNYQAIEQLQKSIDAVALSSYHLQSRVHPLRSLTSKHAQVYMKRDDELSFGISGSKLRKYSSLVPHLLEKGITKAVLIGGAFSNNVLGLSQLLIENGIRPILLLRKPGNEKLHGNYLFTRMLVPPNDVVIIDRQDWVNVDEMAMEYGQDDRTAIIPEGAFLEESLPGALSLALDVIRNEQDLGVMFDHIFVDAGTGLQAIALILGLAYCTSSARVHVVLLAQTEDEFVSQLNKMVSVFQSFVGDERRIQLNFKLHLPTEAASFGSTTKKGLSDIVHFARNEGVILDPIYSGKLVTESKKVITGECVKGNILIIHSGGGLSLAGYQSQISMS